MQKTSVLAAVVLSTFAGVACDDATDLDFDGGFTANLTTGAEIPAPNGNSTATGIAMFELEDGILTVVVTIDGLLTSDVTMAHIHGPASAIKVAGILLDFAPSMTDVIARGTQTGTIVSASFDLISLPVSSTGLLRMNPETLVSAMRSGQTYVNIHTVDNPMGELRGKISPR